jgi:hypothetical protein
VKEVSPCSLIKTENLNAHLLLQTSNLNFWGKSCILGTKKSPLSCGDSEL